MLSFIPLTFFLSISANINLNLEPDTKRTMYFILEKDASDMQIKVYKLDVDSNIKYSFVKDDHNINYDSSNYEYSEENEYDDLGKEFVKKISDNFTYKFTIHNFGNESASVNLHTQTNNPMGNEDADVKAIRKLFSDIENLLIGLYNSNMRLKTMQDKSILEAKRIIRGLYMLFLLPIIYFAVGFIKVKATVNMFALKKGIKP